MDVSLLEESAFQNLVYAHDIIGACLMNFRSKFHQLFVPGRRPNPRLAANLTPLVCVLQNPVLLFYDATVIRNRLHVGGLQRGHSPIDETPARFRDTAHNFQFAAVKEKPEAGLDTSPTALFSRLPKLFCVALNVT